MPRRIYSGPIPADVMVIGDFPQEADFQSGEPFSDYNQSSVLTKAFSAMKLAQTASFRTYVSTIPEPEDEKVKLLSPNKKCPNPTWEYENGYWVSPQLAQDKRELLELIQQVQPKIIIACGLLALWATTGYDAPSKWRGSRLSPPGMPCPVVPTLSLLATVTQSDMLPVILMDFRRARNIYDGTQLPRYYQFELAPTFRQVLGRLDWLLAKAASGPIRLSGDLETRVGHIACFGIAWSAEEAICIPHLIIPPQSTYNWGKLDVKTGEYVLAPKFNEEHFNEVLGHHLWHQQRFPETHFYWTAAEEVEILSRIQELFLHPNVLWVGQNYLYDCQYFSRHWGFLPIRVFDTMIGHHSIYSNMRKGLDFLSSMYAQDHVYWKDESKDWDPKIGERQYWTYNCKDACITWEITDPILESQKDRAVAAHCEFQQSLFFPVLRMMDRGIRYNKALRGSWDPIMEKGTGLKGELVQLQIARQRDLDYVAGHPLNPQSPAQLSRFLYEDLKIPGVKNLTGDSLTTNSPAMALIAERVPALRKLCQLIVELRSLQVFLSTFIDAKLDIDERMRCSFGIAGPETYRFNSRENAFGSGMNLQNIPMSEKQKIKAEDYIKLPNIRKLFLPDVGYVFFDMDLDRADLQVVVWEADDLSMKKVLHLGLDIHCVNACDIFKIKGIPYEELSESHPNYKDHRGKIGEAKRGKAKAGVHATNYGVGDRKLAMALGITVYEAADFRRNWFAAHPGILRWHKRVEQEGTRRGYIENRFGARLYTLGRFDLPVALGWGPQSTVAGVINRALVAIDKAEQEGKISAKLLLQVHDSLGGQIRADRLAEDVPYLQQLAAIPIPYADPLIIPTSVNLSPLSWGDCK